MPVSRGTKFQSNIKRDLLKIPDIIVERLYDVTTGNSGQRTPSDYMVYKYPVLMYVECKSTSSTNLPIRNITQLPDLLDRCQISGVKSYVFVWFVQKKRTFAIDARAIQDARKYTKSLNVKWCENNSIEIPCVYKRVFGVYDFSEIIGAMSII